MALGGAKQAGWLRQKGCLEFELQGLHSGLKTGILMAGAMRELIQAG
jgi:hypothetical protein